MISKWFSIIQYKLDPKLRRTRGPTKVVSTSKSKEKFKRVREKKEMLTKLPASLLGTKLIKVKEILRVVKLN